MNLDDGIGFWDVVLIVLLANLAWGFVLYVVRSLGKAWRGE